MRHYLNLRILWAVLTEFATVGPYDLDWATQQYKCWISQVITFLLLAGLQALNLFWLFFILRILWKYAVTSVPEDELSDHEEGEDEAEDADVNGVAIEGTNGEAEEGLKLSVNGKVVGEVTQEKGGKIKAKKQR